MAAVAVLHVEHGWAGDRKRNRVQLTVASATTDSVTPNQVGLQEIEAVQATGRIGSYNGNTLVSCSHASLNKTGDVLICYTGADADAALSSGNVELYFYGK
jgi:hypothetical protein